MIVPTRSYSSNSYRYGFQAQEKDDEIKGEGNSINYKFRMHDPRVGRFFAVDPLMKEYPHYTPYSYSGNKVINHTEREGLEEEALAVAFGPPGWAYIAAKWIVIGTVAAVTVYTADKAIDHFRNAPDLVYEPISTLPKVDVDTKPTNSNKPNKKPKPIPVFPKVYPDTPDDDDDDSEYVYRAMAKDPVTGQPRISTSLDPSKTFSKDLGAKTDDVTPLLNSQGNVFLNWKDGGMSAAPTSDTSLLQGHIQQDLATGKRKLFRIKKTHLIANGLFGLEDKPGIHVAIKPKAEMSIEQFQTNIRNTRSLWEETTPKKK